jgi:hypothetical protein
MTNPELLQSPDQFVATPQYEVVEPFPDAHLS